MYFPNQNDPYYYTLRFLQYSSYYPWPHQAEKWYKSTSILVRVLTSFVSIECALHCTMALRDRIPVEISEDIALLTGVSNCMFVSGMFQIQAKQWSSCILNIIDTKKFGVPPKMRHMVKKTERFAIWYAIYCTLGILTYTFYSTIEETSCHEQNLKLGTHEICGMITSFWWPYKEINPIAKLFFNFYQLVSLLLILPPAALVTFASWAASQIIKTKIHHLNDLFAHVFADKEPMRQKARLRFCIQYHQHIFKISGELNCINKLLFGQSSFTAAIIFSCIGSQILKEYSVVAFLHLMGYMMAVFLLCETGQNILDETLNVRHAVYRCDWHLADSSLAKDIQLVLLRSQKPILMDSYLFGSFSYSLLISIVKTAYSYLTLMNKVSI